jgi:hypothetical protein
VSASRGVKSYAVADLCLVKWLISHVFLRLGAQCVCMGIGRLVLENTQRTHSAKSLRNIAERLVLLEYVR